MSAPVEHPAPLAVQSKHTPLRIAVQVIGFGLGIAMLWWAVRTTLSQPGLQEKLPKLLETPWLMTAGLLAISAATGVISALVFWIMLLPVRRIPLMDLIALHGLCSVLSLVPFKMSLLFRVLTHSRVHRMPLPQIGGWFVAVALVIVISLLGAGAAPLFKGDLSATWWLIAFGGPIVVAGVMVLVCSRLVRAGERGAVLSAVNRFGPGIVHRLAASKPVHNLSRGVVMLAHPGAVGAALLARFGDVALQAARFYLAAEVAIRAGIVDQGLSVGQCVLAGTVYFFVQMSSPAGAIGPREAATLWVLSLDKADTHVGVIVLVVSAAETAMNIVMAAAGALWLRPSKYMSRA